MPRRLGQHFLRPDSVERLVRVIAPEAGDTFLEIGAGAGALTIPLAARCRRVVAVELDADLVLRLRSRVPDNVEIVHGDALGLDLGALVPRGSRLAGNLPYAISSPLLRRFLELRGHVTDVHAMLQREVADRVSASPGSKAFGVLSVMFGLWADLDVPLHFAPGCFAPPPRVASAVLRARFLAEPRASIGDPAAFERLVQRAFAHRRKTLENNLQDSYPNLKEYLRLLNIMSNRRAETLSIVEFAALSQALTGE